MKAIPFYFDFISPYSYFAWERHKKLLDQAIEFDYKPVVLAKLLNHWELVGPGMVKPKREFMLRQCYRIAHRENYKFCTPKAHPFNPLYALRLATNSCSHDKQFEVIQALWELGWQNGDDLSNPEAIEEYLDRKGLNGNQLMEQSFSRESKLEVKSNIKEAINSEVFGVPSFIFENELFWGLDSMHDLINSYNQTDYWNREAYLNSIAHTKVAIQKQSLS